MSQDSERYQPKSVIWREVGYQNHMMAQQGVLDWDQSFDNEFSEFKALMKLATNTAIAIDRNLLKLDKIKDILDLKPFVKKFNKLWWGNVYFGIILGRQNEFDFLYEMEKNIYHASRGDQDERRYELVNINNYTELIKLPKLQNMVPVGQIRDDTWGIQVRESLPIKYAFAGTSYDTLVNNANFSYRTMAGLVPKFQQNDLLPP